MMVTGCVMSERRNSMSTRAVVEGAIFAAIAIALYLLGNATQLVIMLAYPVPAALIAQRHGLKAGVMASIVAALGIGMTLGPIHGIISLMIIGLPGVVLGLCIKRSLSWAWSTAITGAVLTFTTVADFILGAYAIGITPQQSMEELRSAFVQSMEMTRSMYEKLNMGPEVMKQLDVMSEQMGVVLGKLLPAILVISSLMTALVAYAITRAVIIRMKGKADPIARFSSWAMPIWFVWAPVAGLAMPMLGGYLKADWITAVGNNLFTGSMLLYMVHALALVWFFTEKQGVPKALRFVICGFLYIMPLTSSLMPYAGVLDSFYDFRKLRS